MRWTMMKVLISMGVLYVATAVACGDGGGSGSTAYAATGGGGASGSGGSGGLDGGACCPAPPVEVAVVPCDKTADFGGSMVPYAEHAYPGLTAAEVGARVTPVIVRASPNGLLEYGSKTLLANMLVTDGMAAVVCLDGNAPLSDVTFTLH